jgi:hypothetical protein
MGIWWVLVRVCSCLMAPPRGMGWGFGGCWCGTVRAWWLLLYEEWRSQFCVCLIHPVILSRGLQFLFFNHERGSFNLVGESFITSC